MIKFIQENSDHKLDQSPIPYFFRESQEHPLSDFFFSTRNFNLPYGKILSSKKQPSDI